MLRAKETFHAFTADGMRPVGAGTELPEDHPLVKGREHLFEAVPGAAPAAPKAPRKTARKTAAGKKD